MKKKIKLLIVEDEVIFVQSLCIDLESDNYEVCCYATTGEEAVIKAEKAKPDLVLMDINLPGKIDGIDAAREISEVYNIPIIFMTGYRDPFIFERAQKVNPVAYLTKPVETSRLKSIIDSYIAERLS